MCCCHKLNPLALGMALGVIWGFTLFVMGLIAASGSSYGVPFITAIGTVYIGYAPSFLGSLMGGIIGFIDAFIDGFILGFLYNLFAGCCKKKAGKCSDTCNCCNCSAKEKSDETPDDID